MRSKIVAGVFAAIAIGGSQPATAAQFWPFEGLFSVVTAPVACGNSVLADEIYTAIYRPKIGADTNPGALHLYKLRQAVRMTDGSAASQFRGNGAYAGFLLNGRGLTESYNGTFTNIVVTPATLSATTKFVTMTGAMSNFENTAGCNITFRASFELRAH